MSCMSILQKKDIVEIEMDLTGTCNLKCPLCTRNYKHAEHLINPNSRPLDQIIHQLDEFINLKKFYLAGTISEPTLYKHLIPLVKYLIRRNIQIEMFTNGNTNTPEWWEELGETFESSQDKVYFTICGSTQQLHETYRIGSSLDQLLRNHQAFKSKNKYKNDFIQHIMFHYNKEDFQTEQMQKIISNFSGIKKVDTEGRRSFNEYLKVFDKSIIRPEDTREKMINAVFDTRPSPSTEKKYDIKCMSLRDKKLYIDQFGKISPCYGHAEFVGPGFFSDSEYNYSDILNFKFHDCFKCEKRTQKLIEVLGIDFVC